MSIFFGLIIWVGLVSLLSMTLKHEKRRRKFVIFFSALGIFLIQALRSPSIGTDVYGYLLSYNLVESFHIFSDEGIFNYEKGYILYSFIFNELNFSNQLYLAVVALTIIVPVSVILYKYSEIPTLSILLYITLGFFAFSFSGLRQAIAISIIFYSFKYIIEKSLFKFLISVLIAMSFHFSAIIFVSAYYIYNLKIKKRNLIFIIPVFIILFLLKSPIFLFFYNIYIGESGEIVETGAYTMLVAMIFIYLLSYIFGNKSSLILSGYQNFMLVAIFVQIFASQSNIAMRAGYYYFIFVILLIPAVIKNQKDVKIRFISVYVLTIVLIYFFYHSVGNGQMNIVPYKFF